MPFAVLLTNDAARDLDDLYDYIPLNDAPGNADYVSNQIKRAFCSLSYPQSAVPIRKKFCLKFVIFFC